MYDLNDNLDEFKLNVIIQWNIFMIFFCFSQSVEQEKGEGKFWNPGGHLVVNGLPRKPILGLFLQS